MSNSTHRVLAVPELLLRIFGLSSAADLDNLALVNSSWCGTEIDTKWRTCVVPLTQLLAKLPPFYDEKLAEFCEPEDDDIEISEDEWSCFQQYANKVTRIEVDRILYLTSSAVLQHHLTKLGRPMCPNLLCLDIDAIEEDPDELEPTLAVLAGLQLRVFKSNGGSFEDEDLIRRRRIMVRLSPHITKLIVVVGAHKFPTTPDYTEFTNLHHVHIQGAIWTKGWETLFDYPNLETVEIEEDPSTSGPYMEDEEQAGPGIKESTLHNSSVSTMPELRSLQVNIHKRDFYVLLLNHL
ncbi:hypothetical protein FRB97_005369 [Tulasnella sp. 331]|nr:hypothetical protein FRB97_005369 [Tulasnella sp. 331]